ncbi:hypothetical protein M404DRAFT_36723 [Pisolithus tinctorius Marx 270]|uniref:Reverse transcriptase domain-containing protein n=1 Tax=Pisolithus tinctorius Marx 270 TaxID=870435 RepID=A0A0C3MV06_PISTI|nr:hypothetical protein M404DRAFT_36723 [Pisolithus tinctorius Marx 270]
MDKTFEKQHGKQHIEEFLEIAQEENLHLKISKCVFEAKEVEFLGMIIGKGRIESLPTKTDVISTWEALENLTVL